MTEHNVLFQLKDLWIGFGPAGKSYPVVKRINLNIERGKVLGLVGGSDCGKSVTMLSSMGLLFKNSCEVTSNVLFDGQELNGLSDKEFQKIYGKHISMVSQEPMTSLNPVFTVGQQLSEILRQHLNMTGWANRAKCPGLLSLVSIPDSTSVYNYYPFKLLGGIRQHVMIAMVLVYDPGLIITNEPATALDVATQVQVIGLFRELQKKLNTTITLMSHNLEVIGGIGDNTTTLCIGYVMRECDTRTLFHNSLYPYTFDLMSSHMGHSLKSKDKLYSIPEAVLSAENMPTGRPFAPRCLKTGGQCACEIPPLVEVELDHKIRCWEAASHVKTIG